jgi:hypothetical protein
MSTVDLTNELRLAKPRAPRELRGRVLALSERPVREPRFSFSVPSRYMVRRVALVAAPAVVAIGVGAAAIHGIANSGAPKRAVPATTVPANWDSARGAQATPFRASGKSTSGEKLVPAPGALSPSTTRLQHYEAAMTVRVDTLSPSTQQAMRIARGLGGYVVSAHLNQAKAGRSSLVFRIPIEHVQQAIARFTGLGEITAQNIQITDLQAQFNRLVKQIGTLRIALAKIDDRLDDPSLSNTERVTLEQQRARVAARLEALRTSRARTAHRAALATVSLGLTTAEAAAPVKPHHRGPLGRALHDAGTILQKEASWALYALIVLGPILLVALLAFLLIRSGRRLSDRRLLESS